MPKKKKVDSRWDYTAKHHQQIWEAMQMVLHFETYEKPYSDEKLTQLIRDTGCYTTPTITRDVRLANNVGNSDQRRVEIFARQHAKRGK